MLGDVTLKFISVKSDKNLVKCTIVNNIITKETIKITIRVHFLRKIIFMKLVSTTALITLNNFVYIYKLM